MLEHKGTVLRSSSYEDAVEKSKTVSHKDSIYGSSANQNNRKLTYGVNALSSLPTSQRLPSPKSYRE